MSVEALFDPRGGSMFLWLSRDRLLKPGNWEPKEFHAVIRFIGREGRFYERGDSF